MIKEYKQNLYWINHKANLIFGHETMSKNIFPLLISHTLQIQAGTWIYFRMMPKTELVG